MKNKIEQKVNDSFTNATPDISNRVIADCQAKQVRRTATAKRSNKMTWKLATIALAFVLVVTCLIGGVELSLTAQAASVTLDVNPSIELKLDGKDRVIEVVAHNDDGKEITTDLQLDKLSLDDAITQIIDWLTQKGYITEDANSVLVSVDTKKETTYDKILKKITDDISAELDKHSITSSIISQWLTGNEKIAQEIQSSVDGISTGKATLIQKILDASAQNDAQPYTASDLANLKVNDLALILARYTKESVENKISGIVTSGTVSVGKYNQNDALKKALAEAGIDNISFITNFDVDFDIEKGIIVYEFEFTYDCYNYEIDVQASGEMSIIKFEKELCNTNKPTSGTLSGFSNADLKTKVTEIIENNITEICGNVTDIENIQVIIDEIDVDKDDCEIEVSFTLSPYKYEVTLNYNGEIIGIEKELTTDISKIIDFDVIQEKITQKIKEKYPDLYTLLQQYEGFITIEHEFDDDGTYEVEIKVNYLLGELEYEVEIDATTGKIIEYKRDSNLESILELYHVTLDSLFNDINSSIDAELTSK